MVQRDVARSEENGFVIVGNLFRSSRLRGSAYLPDRETFTRVASALEGRLRRTGFPSGSPRLTLGAMARSEELGRIPLFATTHWSVVLAAGDSAAPECVAALQELCRAYWYPLYAHVRGRGFSQEDAEDLVQEFIASLLRRKSFAGVSPERGRFRSFLLGALKYFLADHHAATHAAKRGGGAAPISMDALSPEARYRLEAVSGESPDVLFDRCWANTLMECVLARLSRENAAEPERFTSLKPFLAAEPSAGDYEALALRWSVTDNAIAQQVRRLRQRCKRLLIEEAARTLAVPGDAEAEIRALFGSDPKSSPVGNPDS